MYLTEKKCKICSENLTIDDVNNYEDVCFSCCSEMWSKYEKAHSGECNFNAKRKPISEKLKSFILLRDNHCLKCGSNDDLTIDHVIPVSIGGDNSHKNLQCLCRKCNSIKSNYPEDYREVVEL